MTDLVLASSSPRRQSFLAALGLTFTVDPAEVDESAHDGEPPEGLVLRLSQEKARAVALRYPNALVLAADTVVVLDGRMLGKPADPSDAGRMLRALRGRVHQVYTAVSVASGGVEEWRSRGAEGQGAGVVWRVCRSDVWMREYGDAEIGAYVASGDPLDKAGAYAIQHAEFAPVTRWDGCFASIMGLPLGIVAELLREAGVPVTAEVVATCEQFSGRGNCCLRRPAPQC